METWAETWKKLSRKVLTFAKPDRKQKASIVGISEKEKKSVWQAKCSKEGDENDN